MDIIFLVVVTAVPTAVLRAEKHETVSDLYTTYVIKMCVCVCVHVQNVICVCTYIQNTQIYCVHVHHTCKQISHALFRTLPSLLPPVGLP